MKTLMALALLALIQIPQTSFATEVQAHCEGVYSGIGFKTDVKINNDYAFQNAAGFATESHYCGASTLLLLLTKENTLELQVRSNQGCSYSDSFIKTLATFGVNEVVTYSGKYGDNSVEINCK